MGTGGWCKGGTQPAVPGVTLRGGPFPCFISKKLVSGVLCIQSSSASIFARGAPANQEVSHQQTAAK